LNNAVLTDQTTMRASNKGDHVGYVPDVPEWGFLAQVLFAPGRHDPQPMAACEPRLTADTVESPLR
jgi:hypothetical protein